MPRKTPKQSKIRSSFLSRKFLFPKHLPLDIGAECTDFLSIHEQCRIRRTSVQIEKFVHCALNRTHTKGIVSGPQWEAQRNLVGVVTACPYIDELYRQRVLSFSGIKRRPVYRLASMEFYLGVGSFGFLRYYMDVTIFRGLAITKHLKCIDLTLQGRNSPDKVLDTLKMFPRLGKLCLSVCWKCCVHGTTKQQYAPLLERMAATCNKIHEVHFEIKGDQQWNDCQRCLPAFTTWRTLRSLKFSYGIAIEDVQSLLDMTSLLPASVHRITIGPTWRDTCERLLESIEKSLVASSFGWLGNIDHEAMTLNLKRC